MITAFFIFTAVVVIALSIKMAGAILGNGITMPAFFPLLPILDELTPSTWIIMYPSIGFQVWFWADKAGLFV